MPGLLPGVLACLLPAAVLAGGPPEDYGRPRSRSAKSQPLIDEESRRLRADMEELRRRSEEMRRQLGGAGEAPGSPAFAAKDAPLAGDPLPDGKDEPLLPRLLRAVAPFIALTALAGVAYVVERRNPGRWGPKPRVVLKCPGCTRRLRVKKSDKRLRLRCPECGTESAYNPAARA